MFFIGRTDGRSTQNYSSEPHKTSQKKLLIYVNFYDNFMLIYIKIIKKFKLC